MRHLFDRYRRYVPAVFFAGGFIWDAVTLGRVIKSLDLVIIFAYLLGAAAILLLIGRGVEFRGSRYLNPALQFFFGGIFSALFIFYFLSSSDLPGYLVVMALAALLVGNEFMESRYSELTVSWAFFTLCAAMFFNFALAHVFHSISVFWFYLGTLVAMALVILLRRLSTKAEASLVPAIGVALLMLVLHAVNAIPPVPLVQKEMLVAHAVRRTASGYTALVESAGVRFWRKSSTTFHRAAGERVYCFTSVFVPNGIRTTIHHRWLYFDEARGEWVGMGSVPIEIAGGRQGGFRGYSYKSNARPGRWRVIAAAESGASIGIVDFRVVDGEKAKKKTVRL
ncbi:MAG TPA: DUF2914 domain-containing protein [Thermoanaerobaculia bacterium]